MSKNVVILFALFTGIMAGACLGQDGKATFDYLQKDRDVLNLIQPRFKELKIPTPPVPPKFTHRTKLHDRILAQKQYRAAQIQYLTNLTGWSGQMLNIWTGLQDKLSGLGGKEVDPSAVAFVVKQEAFMDDQIQALIKVQIWATQFKEAIQKPHAPDFAIPALILGVAELAYGSPLGLKEVGVGLAQETKQSRKAAEEQTALANGAAAMQAALEKLNSDSAELRTAKNEMVTQFTARYPEFDWRPLLGLDDRSASKTDN